MASTPLELSPGHSLGPFQLGSMLFNTLNHVRTYRSTYPNARIAWDEQDPSAGPLHLNLTSPPLHLTFSPFTQRLCRISVSGLSPGSWVSYRGRPLQVDGDEDEDVVRTVRRVMGPTGGSSKVEQGEQGRPEEVLSYPGVAFGVVSSPSGSTLSRIVLTPLPSPPDVPLDRAWLHPVLPAAPSAAAGDLQLSEIYLDSMNKPSHVVLRFYRSGNDEGGPEPLELRIGETTSEDVLCELGGAIRTFWKEDDRLSIHTASLSPSPSASPAASTAPSYFLSYPHLGLTLLLSTSPRVHTLAKIILHSNLPGEVNFGRTARASWALFSAAEERLVGGDEGWDAVREVLGSARGGRGAGGGASRGSTPSPPGSTLSPPGMSNGVPISGGGGGVGGGKKRKSPTPNFGSPAVDNLLGLSTFDVHEAAGSSGAGANGAVNAAAGDDAPMILDRTAADGGRGKEGEGVRGKTTEIHGFPGLAFEVTQEGEVETVWLF
ncbi:hypothetical protein JCM10207_001247 [Rhodosporidiobolus poonsookiae]